MSDDEAKIDKIVKSREFVFDSLKKGKNSFSSDEEIEAALIVIFDENIQIY